MNTPLQTDDVIPCNLCGLRSATYLYPKLGMIRCDGCGLVRADVIPSREELRSLYSKEYFQSADSGAFGYEDYMADRNKISTTFQKRMHEIEQWVGRRGKLLDVGCAAGFSLDIAKGRGWDAHGIEISEFACEFARQDLGLDILCGSLDDADFETGTFDVITMWDYIEHCADPAGQLMHASRLLKTSGLLALTTPDIASLPARIWGPRWMGIKQGEHLYYFSPDTIKRLLRMFHFEPVRLEHVGKYIDVDFFVKRVGLYSSKMERLLQRSIQLLGIGHRVLYVNPFDIMLVYARRVDMAE